MPSIDRPAGQAPLLSILGGKITTYRRLAEHALELSRSWGLPRGHGPPGLHCPGAICRTATSRRSWTTCTGARWLPSDLARRYARAYGSRATKLLAPARPGRSGRTSGRQAVRGGGGVSAPPRMGRHGRGHPSGAVPGWACTSMPPPSRGSRPGSGSARHGVAQRTRRLGQQGTRRSAPGGPTRSPAAGRRCGCAALSRVERVVSGRACSQAKHGSCRSAAAPMHARRATRRRASASIVSPDLRMCTDDDRTRNLSNWLRDAYAMEGRAIELLEAQINRLEAIRRRCRAAFAPERDQADASGRAGQRHPEQARGHRHARRPSCQELPADAAANPPLCGDGGAGDPARQLLRGSGRSSRLVCGCAAGSCD